MRTLCLAVLGGACATAAIAQMQNTGPLNRDLRPPSSFSSITNQAERSRALFGEIAKVLTHPRCMNCHPAGEHPLQGEDHHEHMPPGLARRWRHRHRRAVVLLLPYGKELHTGRDRCGLQEHPRPSALGPRAARDGMARQIGRPDPPADQGPEPQWRAHARTAARTSRARRSRGLGMVARRRPRGSARHAGAVWRACEGLDRQRRGVSELKTSS